MAGRSNSPKSESNKLATDNPVATDLFLKQAGYLIDAKKLYLEHIEQAERTYLLAIGGTMLFLSTDALKSIHPTFYALFWGIPSALSLFTFFKIGSLNRSLSDIADFEIDHVERFLGDGYVGWEGHLRGGNRNKQFRRGSHVSTLLKLFWLSLFVGNAAFMIIQLVYGPVFKSS